MFISFFSGKVMLFYGISLIMKEKSNASALGGGDERIWDGVHLYLVPHSLRGIGIETGSYKLLVCLNL